MDNTVVIEIRARHVLSIPVSSYLSVDEVGYTITITSGTEAGHTSSNALKRSMISEEDIRLLENSGFSVTRGASSTTLEIRRVKSTNKKVVCEAFIVQGLEHVWYVDNERVYVGLPPNTQLNGVVVDAKGTIPEITQPFMYDNTRYEIGEMSKTKRTLGASSSDPIIISDQLSRNEFLTKYTPRTLPTIRNDANEVFNSKFVNSAYTFPSSGVWRVEGHFKFYNYLKMTVDFTQTQDS